MLALGLRRIGRQRLGDIRAVNFERVSAGLALLSHGSNLVTGVGAEIAGGTFGFCGSGLALHVDGYFFARPDAPGIDTIFTNQPWLRVRDAGETIDRAGAVADGRTAAGAGGIPAGVRER